ncbi:MAG: hypothetical protein JWN22_2835 [Nocardioides sp.]|nr:hypothetical protein [Nocardioides sp.]
MLRASSVDSGHTALVLIRASAAGAQGPAAQILGLVVGAVGAMTPSAYFDSADGAGALRGAVFGYLAMAVVSPIALTFMVCHSMCEDDEHGLVREAFLAGASIPYLRIGSLLELLRNWFVVLLAACSSGALVGLGDSLRHSSVGGGLGGVTFQGLAYATIVQVYVILVSLAACAMVGRAAPSASLLVVSALVAVLATPFLRAHGALVIVALTPYSPLLGTASSPIFGRFAASDAPHLAASYVFWVLISGAVIVGAVRRHGWPLAVTHR